VKTETPQYPFLSAPRLWLNKQSSHLSHGNYSDGFKKHYKAGGMGQVVEHLPSKQGPEFKCQNHK
jgi:hypothetical protein